MRTLLLSSILLAACGESNDSGGAGSSSSESSTSAASTEVITTADASTSSGEPPCTESCEPCEEQVAPATPTPVTVTIVNATDASIYLEGTQLAPMTGHNVRQEYVLYDDVTGSPLHSYALPCEKELSCSALASEFASCTCSAGLVYPPVTFRIVPGGSYTAVAWDSLVWELAAVASRCINDQCGSESEHTSCPRQQTYTGASVSAVARASSTLVGDDCAPGEADWCQTDAGALPGEPLFEAQVEVALPTEAITITFE